MARIKGHLNRVTRKKKLFRRVKGFFLGRKNLAQAIEHRMRADRFRFAGRKQKKRQFRRLWNQRINAAARAHGLSYSKLIHGLKVANVAVNRKMLADMALHEPAAFAAVVERAKAAL